MMTTLPAAPAHTVHVSTVIMRDYSEGTLLVIESPDFSPSEFDLWKAMGASEYEDNHNSIK
jgi:hypothetical protein